MIVEEFRDKKILITGGTGSLGKALVKRLYPFTKNITIYSRDEGKQALSFIQYPEIKKVLGDIRDRERTFSVFSKEKPDFVIHAAALKRIDDLELSPEECIKTNIQGSINVADAAMNAFVKKCILVSTDKACTPVNVYGASKFTAERIFTNKDYEQTRTIFSSVRYGNVIASRGSFIPHWLELGGQDKPVPVTSLQCTRFLFTLTDAVNTVLSSLIQSEGGEVFVPCFDSFNMDTVLKATGNLLGSELDHFEVGMRPGEKFHEDMVAALELSHTYWSEMLEGLQTPHCNRLLKILPQYSNRFRTLGKKYKGPEINSQNWLNSDVGYLTGLIKSGLEDE